MHGSEVPPAVSRGWCCGENGCSRVVCSRDVSSGMHLDVPDALNLQTCMPWGLGCGYGADSNRCSQVFGDDEKVYGWSDVPGFQIDIWLSQSNYSSMLEVRAMPPPPSPPCTSPTLTRQTPSNTEGLAAQVLPEGKRRPEGATDVAEALSKWFPGGSVQRQREVFQVAAAEPLDLTQLGGEVLEVPAASPPRSDGHGAIQDGSTAVYRHRLSEANSYVKVRLLDGVIKHMATGSARRTAAAAASLRSQTVLVAGHRCPLVRKCTVS